MEDQTFGFILEYQGRNVYCEVVCDEGHYMIFFDGKHEAEIEMNEEPEWEQMDGNHLPHDIVQEIGQKIELKEM